MEHPDISSMQVSLIWLGYEREYVAVVGGVGGGRGVAIALVGCMMKRGRNRKNCIFPFNSENLQMFFLVQENDSLKSVKSRIPTNPKL